MRSLRAYLPLIAAIGCSSASEPINCPDVIIPAIEVVVVDARTGLPQANGALGLVRDGAYTDSLQIFRWNGNTPTTLGAAEGRRGTYAVQVERDGYGPWQRTGITPRVGACGVETTTLRAELVPLG